MLQGLSLLILTIFFSCALPYDYGFVTDIFTGQCPYKFSTDATGEISCFCEGYDPAPDNKSCIETAGVKACKAEAGASYDAEANGDYCACGTDYIADAFGFCSISTGDIALGTSGFTSEGSLYPIWTGYSLLNQSIFYDTSSNTYLCRTFLNSNKIEAITNCRGKSGGSLNLNFYSELKSTTGIEIKDVLFLLYDSGGLQAKEFVLSADDNLVYKQIIDHTSLGDGLTPTAPAATDLTNDGGVVNNCGSVNCYFKLIAPDPAEYATSNPPIAGDDDVKFIAIRVGNMGSGTGLYYQDVATNPLITGSFTDLKFGVDASDNYFYTYKSGVDSKFVYNSNTPLNGDTEGITASDIFYYIDDTSYKFVYQKADKKFHLSIVTSWQDNNYSLITNFSDAKTDFKFNVYDPAIFVAQSSDAVPFQIYDGNNTITNTFPGIKDASLSNLILKVKDVNNFTISFLKEGGNTIATYKFTEN